ncbi:MAG: patatin-like phospholipase family protein [Chromatiaceae bacterium]|jgi:NTE family protein|nr:patatin-like phospholipase family protein [Chromatiaceae bacterium]
MPDEPVLDVANAPVEYLPSDRGPPAAGLALCLSGGGYRAMVFHIGVIWRLYEAGILGRLARISSVSGGSITAAWLGLVWNQLQTDASPDRRRLEERFVRPLRRLAGETIDAWGIVGGMMLPGTISEMIQASYRKHLFGKHTLQDLPDAPRFVINATNVQSGALWRFSKPYMRDYRVGEVRRPTVELAAAVAASSAFPPVLSPMTLTVDPASFTPGSGADLQREPFTRRVLLSDGGVYDNLGLETAYKRYDTLLVSDAGAKLKPEEEPKEDWARHAFRVLDLIDNQVRSLRKRQLIQAYATGARQGAYWGIRSDITQYPGEHLPCPIERTLALAAIPTRLKRLDDTVQERLINWGYAICDAALRAYVERGVPKGTFPYPAAGV